MSDAPTILRWIYPHGERGPHFALVRLREPGEPEMIGSVLRHTASAIADRREGWRWSLACHLVPVGIEPARTHTSGTEDTKRAACKALLVAWAIEAAWRAEVRARPDFEGLSPYVRDFVVNGQPAPPKWKGGAEHGKARPPSRRPG